jgi:uncharacterized membrane protein YciS (DUF1049 family)
MDADTAYTIAIILFGVGAVTVAINIGLLWLNFKIYTRFLRHETRANHKRRHEDSFDDDGW